MPQHQLLFGIFNYLIETIYYLRQL